MKAFLLTILFASQVFAATYTEKVEFIPTLHADGYCNILKRTTVLRDGAAISTDNHRYNLEPESDLSQFDARVKAACKSNWTPEIVKKFKEEKAKRDLALKKGPLQ
jgi:hypothetical protein